MSLPMRWILVVLFFVMGAVYPAHTSADWTPLIKRLVADNFDEKNIQALFSSPRVKFDPDAMSCKLKELIKNRYKKPEPMPDGKYRDVHDRFLKPAVIDEARSYTQKNMATLKDIEKSYCVPREIVVAILLIETNLGVYLGSRPAFNTLASMAASTNLETIRPYLPPDLITPENQDFAMKRCNQKSDWAYRELKALIRYASERGIDPLGMPGSIYGAVGLCQFMPSKISAYGVDADNDGQIDVFSKDDALFSIANYLRHHGWKCKMSKGRKRKIIMAYNHSNIYANTVLQIAEKLRQKN
jgi:membrane-bound lytic murein transglycosylase B